MTEEDTELDLPTKLRLRIEQLTNILCEIDRKYDERYQSYGGDERFIQFVSEQIHEFRMIPYHPKHGYYLLEDEDIEQAELERETCGICNVPGCSPSCPR